MDMAIASPDIGGRRGRSSDPISLTASLSRPLQNEQRVRRESGSLFLIEIDRQRPMQMYVLDESFYLRRFRRATTLPSPGPEFRTSMPSYLSVLPQFELKSWHLERRQCSREVPRRVGRAGR
jgi:hypothetical protein